MKHQKFHNEMHFISFFKRQLVQIERNSLPPKILISPKNNISHASYENCADVYFKCEF